MWQKTSRKVQSLSYMWKIWPSRCHLQIEWYCILVISNFFGQIKLLSKTRTLNDVHQFSPFSSLVQQTHNKLRQQWNHISSSSHSTQVSPLRQVKKTRSIIMILMVHITTTRASLRLESWQCVTVAHKTSPFNIVKARIQLFSLSLLHSTLHFQQPARVCSHSSHFLYAARTLRCNKRERCRAPREDAKVDSNAICSEEFEPHRAKQEKRER